LVNGNRSYEGGEGTNERARNEGTNEEGGGGEEGADVGEQVYEVRA
jgi:hypothetical protein